MSAEQPTLATSVSITRKVNLGNYESADVFMSISGITAETTRAQLEELVETQAEAYEVLKVRVKERVLELRNPKAQERGK